LAQVILKINGYSYTVGCEDGQEEHLQAMARQVENRIDSIKALGGQSGEGRLLALAALLMADELHDLRTELESARASAGKPGRKSSGEGTKRLQKLAARAEQIADELDLPPH
jgi:cell division protein ZapA